MNPTHDALRDSMGAYVVGAVTPAERTALEAHLSECAQCRGALTELAPLPGLLGRLTLDEVAVGLQPLPDSPVDDAIRLVGRAQRSHHRRLRGWQALAAALAALVLVLVPLRLFGGEAPSVRLAPEPAAPDAALIEGSVTLTARDWGMEVVLELRHLPPRRGYNLVAVADDGHETPAASWSATESGAVTLTGSCYLPLERLVRMEVVSSDGEVLAAFQT